jgi:hypothetical protein
MHLRLLAFYPSFALALAGSAFGQHFLNAEAIQAETRQCRIIKSTLDTRAKVRAANSIPKEVPADDFTAAGLLCENLETALQASDEPATQQVAHDLYVILARMDQPPATPAERLAAMDGAASGKTGTQLFYALPRLAKAAFEAGDMDKAQSYATRLIEMASQYPNDWNYGNAIHDGYMVLGRVALRRGNVALAEQDLLNAGSTKGSPQLNSFGPNVSLAKDLLEKGRTATVLQYFALCKIFWNKHSATVDAWSETVRGGGVPNFGANLHY